MNPIAEMNPVRCESLMESLQAIQTLDAGWAPCRPEIEDIHVTGRPGLDLLATNPGDVLDRWSGIADDQRSEILPGSDFLQQFGQRPTPPGNRFEAQSAVACLGSQTP